MRLKKSKYVHDGNEVGNNRVNKKVGGVRVDRESG